GPWTLYTTPANPSGQWTSSPISFGNVTDDGIYDFYTLGTDNLGHVEAPPIGKDATTIVDRYAPISSVNALPTVTASTDFFVTYNATDNGSGIKSVQLFYNFDGGPWMSYGNYLSSPVIFLAVDGDGLYEFYCQATDNLNNIEAKAATMEANITLDTGSPTGLSMVIDGGATYTTDLSVDLELLAIDGTEMSFSNDGIIWSTWEPYGTTKTGWLLMDGDGTKIVYFKCRDSAGNEALTSDSIILDTMDPVAVSVDIDDGAAYAISTSVTLSIYASDANGIYQMMLSNDGVFDSETWEAYATTKAWVLSNGDGIKTVYVLFRDDALLESDVISDTIILDTIDPTGSIMINNGEEYVSSPISVLMLSAYDTNGITMMRISIDGTFDTEIWESFMTSKAWMLSGADGLKEVFVQYMDGAGRVSGTYGSNITLDTTSPVTTASISGLEGNGGWFVGNVTITLTGSDTTSGLNQTYYRINSGPWVSGDSVALDSDGTHTIEYYSVDNAANSEVINFMTVSVDTTAPTVFSTTPVDGSTGVVAGRVIMIEFNEPMNTTTVEASVSLSPVTTISSYTWNNDNTVLRMVLFSDFEENTTYTITIGADAEDAAGNTMASDYTGSFTTWIEEVIDVPEDTTAPTVFSTTPVDGSTGVVAGRVIMIEFNEPMNTTTVEASVSLSPVTTISSYTWNNDNTVLRMVLFSDFEENTTYTITISSGAEDIAGNAMASDYTGSFTTWVEEVIDVLDPGDEDEPDNWWLIHLIFLIIILFVLLAGRRRKKEEPETTPEARTAAVAGAAKAVPPPPEESKDELEFEECPTCGYDMEKGEECPICAGEDGMDEEDEDEYEEDEDEEVDENIPHSEELGWKYKKDGVVDDDDEVYEMGTVMEK
ncbi:MAG: Ig-like domain-containing protein, partial [Thermoplasmata archaeon]|nr:Ig-like domain-containing protein [Thermoplasmata archaeon]